MALCFFYTFGFLPSALHLLIFPLLLLFQIFGVLTVRVRSNDVPKILLPGLKLRVSY